MKTVIHKSRSRGHANHGCLDSHHSFSFAIYFNAERMDFGVLQVLNNNDVATRMDFGSHAHQIMEFFYKFKFFPINRT